MPDTPLLTVPQVAEEFQVTARERIVRSSLSDELEPRVAGALAAAERTGLYSLVTFHVSSASGDGGR